MKNYLLGVLLLGLSFMVIADNYYEAIHAYYNKDYIKARTLWMEVIEQTSSVSSSLEGQGVEPTQKNDAEYGIALLYWQGKGVKQDYKQAEVWLRKAVMGDITEAKVKLAHLYLGGLTGVKKPEYAKTLFTQAAKVGNSDAQYHLGIMWLTGVGGKINRNESIRWLKKSANLGDKRALKKLKEMGISYPFSPMILTSVQKNLVVNSTNKKQSINVKKVTNESLVSLPLKEFNTVKPVSVNKLSSESYVLQVAIVSSLKGINKLVKKYPLKPWTYWVKKKKNKRLYVVVLCCFESKDKAEQQKVELKKYKPLVKKLGSLKLVSIGGVKINKLIKKNALIVSLNQKNYNKEEDSKLSIVNKDIVINKTFVIDNKEGIDSSKKLLHEPDWLKKQNPNNYVMQVVVVSNLKGVKKLIKKYPLKPWAYWVKYKKSKKLYVVTLCCFEGKDKAKQHKANLIKFKPYLFSLKRLLSTF